MSNTPPLLNDIKRAVNSVYIDEKLLVQMLPCFQAELDRNNSEEVFFFQKSYSSPPESAGLAGFIPPNVSVIISNQRIIAVAKDKNGKTYFEEIPFEKIKHSKVKKAFLAVIIEFVVSEKSERIVKFEFLTSTIKRHILDAVIAHIENCKAKLGQTQQRNFSAQDTKKLSSVADGAVSPSELQKALNHSILDSTESLSDAAVRISESCRSSEIIPIHAEPFTELKNVINFQLFAPPSQLVANAEAWKLLTHYANPFLIPGAVLACLFRNPENNKVYNFSNQELAEFNKLSIAQICEAFFAKGSIDFETQKLILDTCGQYKAVIDQLLTTKDFRAKIFEYDSLHETKLIQSIVAYVCFFDLLSILIPPALTSVRVENKNIDLISTAKSSFRVFILKLWSNLCRLTTHEDISFYLCIALSEGKIKTSAGDFFNTAQNELNATLKKISSKPELMKSYDTLLSSCYRAGVAVPDHFKSSIIELNNLPSSVGEAVDQNSRKVNNFLKGFADKNKNNIKEIESIDTSSIASDLNQFLYMLPEHYLLKPLCVQYLAYLSEGVVLNMAGLNNNPPPDDRRFIANYFSAAKEVVEAYSEQKNPQLDETSINQILSEVDTLIGLESVKVVLKEMQIFSAFA